MATTQGDDDLADDVHQQPADHRGGDLTLALQHGCRSGRVQIDVGIVGSLIAFGPIVVHGHRTVGPLIN